MHRATFLQRNIYAEQFLHRTVSTHKRFTKNTSTQNSFYSQTFYTQQLLHRSVFTQQFFTHCSFYTQTLLHRAVLTHKRLHTQTCLHRKKYTVKPLHRAVFTHIRVYTPVLSHTDAFTHKKNYTEKPLHRADFRHRGLYTERFLDTTVITHKCLYAQKLLHRRFYTEQFFHRRCLSEKHLHADVTHSKNVHTLHRAAFTQRNLCTEQLLTLMPSHRAQSGRFAIFTVVAAHKKKHMPTNSMPHGRCRSHNLRQLGIPKKRFYIPLLYLTISQYIPIVPGYPLPVRILKHIYFEYIFGNFGNIHEYPSTFHF